MEDKGTTGEIVEDGEWGGITRDLCETGESVEEGSGDDGVFWGGELDEGWEGLEIESVESELKKMGEGKGEEVDDSEIWWKGK